MLLPPLKWCKQRYYFSIIISISLMFLVLMVTHKVKTRCYLQRRCLWSESQYLFARHLSSWSSLKPGRSTSWPQRDSPAPCDTDEQPHHWLFNHSWRTFQQGRMVQRSCFPRTNLEFWCILRKNTRIWTYRDGKNSKLDTKPINYVARKNWF